MSAYQFFVSKLNEQIKLLAFSTNRKEKTRYDNNLHVKGALLLLGEETFNSHMTSIVKSAFDYAEKSESENGFEDFYSYLGNSFHKGFRQYDVSDKFDKQKYKTYFHYTVHPDSQVIEEKYNIDGRIDTIVWNAFSIQSDIWDIFHQYATQQYKVGVAK